MLNKAAVDWTQWGNMPVVKLFEAVALSLNLNPEGLAWDRFESEFDAGPEFSKRLKVAVSHASAGTLALLAYGGNNYRSPVRLAIFGTWAAGIWPDLPPKFPRTVHQESARPRTITLPAGTTHVKYGELPDLIADALWPDGGADDERIRYGAACLNLETELAQAVKSGALPVKDALTLGPHPLPVGAALQRALVTVEDLRAFVAGRGLSVLLQYTVNEDGGTTSYLATKEDHDARTAERKERVAQRQARGYFTLQEAAEILAAANGFDAGDYLKKRMRPAVESGALTLRDPIDQGEVTGRPCRTTDWVTPADVNRWLEKDRYSYRWPAPSPAVSDATSNAGSIATGENADQRCARLLLWLQQEKAKGERGALARVVRRDGRARQTVTADIKRAQEQKKMAAANPFAALTRK